MLTAWKQYKLAFKLMNIETIKTKYAHLSEEMANSLTKAKAEVLEEFPGHIDIRVDKEGVTMTPSAAFDLLYNHDRKLWEETLEAFIEIAQEIYLEHHGIDPDSDHDDYLENGVDFTENAILVNR